MASMKKFENEDGSIDWTAYRKAQVDEGDMCMTCGTYVFNLGLFGKRKDYAHDCINCASIKADSGEVSHDHFVRCPKCEHRWNPYDCEDYHLGDAGEGEAWCSECDHTFTVRTAVQCTFTSPPLIKENDDDESARQQG